VAQTRGQNRCGIFVGFLGSGVAEQRFAASLVTGMLRSTDGAGTDVGGESVCDGGILVRPGGCAVIYGRRDGNLVSGGVITGGGLSLQRQRAVLEIPRFSISKVKVEVRRVLAFPLKNATGTWVTMMRRFEMAGDDPGAPGASVSRTIQAHGTFLLRLPHIDRISPTRNPAHGQFVHHRGAAETRNMPRTPKNSRPIPTGFPEDPQSPRRHSPNHCASNHRDRTTRSIRLPNIPRRGRSGSCCFSSRAT